jgi:hypothetical protein
MKLFIPELGTSLELSEPWTFKSYQERRNDRFRVFIGLQERASTWNWRDPVPEPVNVTIPTGAVLIIDRIYIRAGSEDYSSITFRMQMTKELHESIGNLEDKMPKSLRFWVKLEDANTIEYC